MAGYFSEVDDLHDIMYSILGEDLARMDVGPAKLSINTCMQQELIWDLRLTEKNVRKCMPLMKDPTRVNMVEKALDIFVQAVDQQTMSKRRHSVILSDINGTNILC